MNHLLWEKKAVPYLCAAIGPCHFFKVIFSTMKNKEEYTNNSSRDWLIFGASTVFMVLLLFFKPEWVWVAWPFQFTALAGAMGRL